MVGSSVAPSAEVRYPRVLAF